MPVKYFCKTPFLTKDNIGYKLKKIKSKDLKFDCDSDNGGNFMQTFVGTYMINSQTYNEILMVGVKRGKRGAQLIHSVGIIVRDIMGCQK